MWIPGIVSVTFRNLAPREIAEVSAQAKLSAIEWGGDVHVVPSDLANAEAVAAQTKAAGLQVISYGSYFRAGYAPESDFCEVVAAARALGAPNIRIWAGTKGSESETDRGAVAASIRQSAQLAAEAGITLSLELHGGTLTDTPDSALRLIDEVAHDNLHLYWQPNQFQDTVYNTVALRRLLPFVSNVHVFSWDGNRHFPLDYGEAAWRQYLDILSGSGRDHGLLMEFVCDGTTEQFFKDAETLHRWLA